jgi:transposase
LVKSQATNIAGILAHFVLAYFRTQVFMQPCPVYLGEQVPLRPWVTHWLSRLERRDEIGGIWNQLATKYGE